MPMKLSKEQTQVLREMKTAVEFAREIFGLEKTEAPMPEMLFGICERIFNSDAQETALENLKGCGAQARELFGTEKPSPEMVFSIYASLFGSDEEDDE